MVLHNQVPWKQWTCTLCAEQYTNGRPALTLYCNKSGEPIAVASVNLPDAPIDKGLVAIDTNNAVGVDESLVASKILKPNHKFTVDSGFCSYPIYEFTDEIKQKLEV